MIDIGKIKKIVAIATEEPIFANELKNNPEEILNKYGFELTDEELKLFENTELIKEILNPSYHQETFFHLLPINNLNSLTEVFRQLEQNILLKY